MSDNSKIEWTDATWNPVTGCTKVSPGCDHCYAEALMDTRWGKVEWGPHGERKRTSDANWKLPLRWARAANGTRPRVFCASLADWLDNQVPRSWRTDLWGLIEATPELDWLLLTKRIENYAKLVPWHADKIPSNVWLGITAEDQKHYDQRWAVLRQIPATVHFISYEPAIGELYDITGDVIAEGGKRIPDWIICGGESGHGARMMQPEWARAVREACRLQGAKFFMKQMTGKKPIPADLLIREFPQKTASVVTADGRN